MKLAPIKAEQRCLVVLLQNKGKIRNYILRETRIDDFGSEEGIRIRTRIDTLIQNGRELGDTKLFRDDPTLSDDAREFLNVGPNYLKQAGRIQLKAVKRLVSILHDYRKSRALYQTAQEITELCTKQFDENTFLNAEAALLEGVKAIREDRTKKLTHAGRMRSTKQAMRWFRQFMKPRPDQFLSTGLPALDQHMGGYQRGDLVVISAPRGGGKTALLLQCAISQFRVGLNVGIASLEMEENHLWERVVANVCEEKFWNVRARNIKKPGVRSMWRKWWQFERATAKRYNNMFTPWDIKDPEYMPANIELDLGPFGYDVIYVDYISLFGTGKHRDMWRAQKDHSRHLKSLASRLNCVMVVLTQLSKDERVKYGTGPEEDADYWLWWRYGDDEVSTSDVELRLDKARHAQRCILPAKFDMPKMTIKTQGAKKPSMSTYKTPGKGSKGGKGEEETKVRETPQWDADEFNETTDLDSLRDQPELELEPELEPEPTLKKPKEKRRKSRKADTAKSLADKVDAELDEILNE